jgi:hypothetical protein
VTQPCKQGERLAVIETGQTQINKTLESLELICGKTFEVLSVISGQSIQIQALTSCTEKLKVDVEEAFNDIRRIDLLHAKEDGAEEIVEEQQKFWSGVKQQFTAPALMGLCFVVWLNDKYHATATLWKWWKEFK